MGRVAILGRLRWCVLLVLSPIQHAAQGARMLSGRVQDDDLVPCHFAWQIPGKDSIGHSTAPPPPCHFDFRRPRVHSWPPGPPLAADRDLSFTESAHHFDGGMLPPCKDVLGGIPGWDCFDPPTFPLPPCNFKHQRAGFDCWPRSPFAAVVSTVTEAVSAGGGGASTTTQSGAHHVEGMLPACKDVPGGIQGWDCFDPPSTPLPPCDFKHQSPGIDCWPRDPSSARP